MIEDHVWDKNELAALKAAFNGEADAHAQRRVVIHIVEILCRVNATSLVPGNPDATAFNEGRRWVARQIQNALTLPVEKLIEEPHEPRSSRPISATERVARAAVDASRASTGRR